MINLNAKLGVAAIVAALFVAFGAFGLGQTTTTSASPLSPIAVGVAPCTPNGGTPGAPLPSAGVANGTVLCIRANFANTASLLSVTATGTGALTLNKATEYTSVTPAAVDVTQLAVDTNTAALVYEQSTALLTQYPVQPPPLVSLAYDLQATASCSTAGSNGTITFTSFQNSGPFATSLVYPATGSITCIAATPSGDVTTNVISVKKVDQLGVIRGASFAVQQSIAGSAVNFINVATLVTSGTVTSQNPCTTAQSCTTNGSQFCNTGFASNCAQTPGSLPPNVAGAVVLANGPVRVIEIAQPTSCTLVQITDGDGDNVIQPVTLTLPARTNDATLTFINSCQTPLAPVVANSAIAVVIGGATQGLSNSTHLEIIPAPGSDDDARVDIRVRDTNSTNVVGAHVTMSIDKGAMAMRTDTTGPGTNCLTLQPGQYLDQFGNVVGTATGVNPSGTVLPANCYTGNGYEVIEPAPGATYFGSNYAGDTCDQGINQQYNQQPSYTWNPVTNTYTLVSQYNGGVSAPFLLAGTGQLRQIQDGFTNTDGIISACVYVNPDLAPGVTPGKMNVTVIIEAPQSAYYTYGASNIILTATITVVGPPASIKVAASPTSVQCGEKSTITATVTDSVGQNVSDHTRIELVSNAGATIGGTGSTLGFPGVGIANPASSSVAETFSGVGTAFLLTSTEHVGPYEVVVASGGSVGGVVSTAQPGVTYTTGNFSTAPVSAQVTVTCALPVVAAPVVAAAAPIAAPRTGEGIRPPNTGDAGLADASGNSWAFVLAGAVAFALAGFASVKFARR